MTKSYIYSQYILVSADTNFSGKLIKPNSIHNQTKTCVHTEPMFSIELDVKILNNTLFWYCTREMLNIDSARHY